MDNPARSDPVLLPLPSRNAADGPTGPQMLRAVATDYGPQIEQTLLAERLHASPGFVGALADPREVQHHPTPLASLHDYKHRLQSIRCEYVTARLRADDLEAQFQEAQAALKRLQERLTETHNQLEHYRGTLEEIRSSRSLRLLERCGGLRWAADTLAGPLFALRQLLRGGTQNKAG